MNNVNVNNNNRQHVNDVNNNNLNNNDIDHATMVLNPALGASKKTIKRGLHKIKARLQSVDMDNMLKQDCWDK